MPEKSTKKYSEPTIKLDNTLLKIIGVIKYFKAAIYIIGLASIIATGKMTDIINQLGDAVKVDGISSEALIYTVMGLAIVFNLAYGFFSFRATKKDARPVLMLILPVIAIIYTEMTRTGGGLLSGNISWAYIFSAMVNFTAWGCAFQILRQNKKD